MISNNKDYTPFINKLLGLANSSLTARKYEILSSLLTSLLLAMDDGHSCIDIEDFCATTDILDVSSIEVVRLLDESYLCASYAVGHKIALKPLSLVILGASGLLYLTRYLHYEVSCVKALNALNQSSRLSNEILNQHIQLMTQNSLNGEFPMNGSPMNGSPMNGSPTSQFPTRGFTASRFLTSQFPNGEQLEAMKACALHKLSFITGGPGTGKTTTVLLLLVLLMRSYAGLPNKINIHICAPTGKATNRVKESILSNLVKIIEQFALTEEEQELINSISYSTIHKLLGFKKHDIYFRHNRDNPLAVDVLVIDESSMISLPLFYKLLHAINKDKIKHVVFLGDKNQLSSVEEGYVFASLMEHSLTQKYDLFSTRFSVNNLTISNRNIDAIAKVAVAVLDGNRKDIIKAFTASKEVSSFAAVRLVKLNFKNLLMDICKNASPIDNYIECIFNICCDNNSTKENIVSKDSSHCEPLLSNNGAAISVDIANKLFSIFRQFAILCAVNIGELGVNNLNFHLEKIIKHKLNELGEERKNELWYTGKAILILENNANLGLYNGDIGICVVNERKPMIVFENGASFIPEVLPNHQLAYAMTIHKSQGSEFNHVYVLLPDIKRQEKVTQEFLTRELLYTAITRARSSVTIYSDTEAILNIINNRSARTTGLKELLSSL